ncbi:MAG: phasin family protein [Oceanipulchritudo sp.]|jgi:polyhydroxyalkanoate synthesis regulator phasin
MLEALKKTIYAGIGATVVTTEKIESALGELVKKGKLSAEEARETAERISKESRKEFEDAQSSLKSMFEELLEKASVPRRKEIDAVNKRLDNLEKKIGDLKKADS